MKIHWIGDSTVQTNDIRTWPQHGMGQALALYLQPGVAVCNHARNGCSTKSYRAEGRWDAVLPQLQPGDLLLIQFGHNDENMAAHPRYTSLAEYAENLLAYAREAAQVGAYPILVTPLTRRHFEGEILLETHQGYPDAVRTAARQAGLPLIDLTASSRRLVQALGEQKSRALYMVLSKGESPSIQEGLTDNTHLRYPGAVLFAGLIAAGLWKLGGVYQAVCLPLPQLYQTEPEHWPGPMKRQGDK